MEQYGFKVLSDLMLDGVYRVPEYQRYYAWDQQQLRDLWEDLEALDLNAEAKHYTGTIVVERQGENINRFGLTFRQFRIIDGQQRLATLSMLVFCAYERLRAIGGEDSDRTAKNILNVYIIDESTSEYKLKLNGSDDSFLRDVVFQTAEAELVGKEPVSPSEVRLKYAKGFFRKKLSKYGYVEVTSLLEKVSSRLQFIRYEVGNDLEAGLVFEVMNDRGRPLTQADKIKNYLIYLAYKKGYNELGTVINESWGEIFRNLMYTEGFGEDNLLRYHWIAYKGEHRSEDIHRSVKTKLNLKTSDLLEHTAFYVSSLKESSYVFRELCNPDDSFFDYDTYAIQIRNSLNCLHRVNSFATFAPLLIAARIVFKDQPAAFVKIARVCEVFAFRVYKVANRRSDTKASFFSSVAHRLFQSRALEATVRIERSQKILDEIRSIISEYGGDNEIRSQLARDIYGENGDLLDSAELKYLLYEYERFLSANHKEPPPTWDDIESKATIEHIWPRSPRNLFSVDGLFSVHYASWRRLGNLTLTFSNSELSNKDFPAKVELYRESRLLGQRDLCRAAEWGKEQIDERTAQLVDFALDRWHN